MSLVICDKSAVIEAALALDRVCYSNQELGQVTVTVHSPPALQRLCWTVTVTFSTYFSGFAYFYFDPLSRSPKAFANLCVLCALGDDATAVLR